MKLLKAFGIKDFIATIFSIWAGFYLLVYLYRGVRNVQASEIQVSARPLSLINKRMPFITICPNYFSNRSDWTGTSFQDTMKNLSSIKRAILTSSPMNLKVRRSFRVHPSRLQMGALEFEPCFTVEPNDDDAKVALKVNMTNVINAEVHFHQQPGLAQSLNSLAKYPAMHFRSQVVPFKVQNRRVEIELQVTQKEIRLSSSSCATDEYDSYCAETYLADRMKCRLPWDPVNPLRRKCSTNEEFQTFIAIMASFDRLSSSNKIEYLSSEMNCKFPCDYETYDHRVIFDQSSVGESKESITLDLNINLKKTETIIYTESVHYDVLTLIADVGGFTGFLLGYSFLSLFDFIYHLLQRTYNL